MIIGKPDINDLLEAICKSGIIDTNQDFNPPVQVSAHQIRRTNVSHRLTRPTAVSKLENPAVFEEPTHHRPDSDAFAHSGNPRS